MFPGKFKQDWNRSTILTPAGTPVGAAVFLHGLTDAPYSLRHIARAYQARGWVAVLLRVPGHGTVPAGLTKVTTEQWRAATQLAMREARKRVGAGKPIHLVGYSNGAALAVDHALLALADPALIKARPAGAAVAGHRHHRARRALPGWLACRRCSRPLPRRPGSTCSPSITHTNTTVSR